MKAVEVLKKAISDSIVRSAEAQDLYELYEEEAEEHSEDYALNNLVQCLNEMREEKENQK